MSVGKVRAKFWVIDISVMPRAQDIVAGRE